MPIHVTNFVKANWSWAIARYPYSENEKDLANLTDVDSMMINTALEDLANMQLQVPFLFLNDLCIDLMNKIAYRKWSPFAAIEFKLVCTGENDRSRSSLSSRKPFESTAAFQRASDFFARDVAEFGLKWGVDYNNGKHASPRQLIAGIENFFMALMKKEINRADQARIPYIIANY